MNALPPGAQINWHDKAWYGMQLRDLFRAWRKTLNDGKFQLAPYFVFVGLYAMIVFCRWFFPGDTKEIVTGAVVIGIGMLVFSGFCVKSHAKTEIILSAAGIGAVSLWIASAMQMGIDIKVILVGLVLTTIIGIPYWYALAKITNPGHTYVTATAKEEVAPPREFENVPWMKPDGDWYGPIRSTQTGYIRDLKIPSGGNARKFITANQGGLANHLSVDFDEVEFEEVKKRADLVRVKVHNVKDFLEEPTLWPLMDSHEFNIWKPFPIGMRKSGELVYLDLNEKHFLIGGVSGSGKSNVTSMICAVGAHDPNCDLWLFDGKRNELFHWRKSARGYVQDNIDDAVRMLQHLVNEMYWRYDQMNAMPVICRKATESGGVFGPVLVVIDELAGYLREGVKESDQQKVFRTLLATLLEKGRAAGFIVVGNTQRPSAKLFDGGDLRAGFTNRMALRMTDGRGSSMILGDGYGVDSSRFDQECRGMAYMIIKGVVVIVRAFYVPDAKLLEMIDSAPVLTEEDGLWGHFFVNESKSIESSERPVLHSVPRELTSSGSTKMIVTATSNNEQGSIHLPNGEWLREDWHVSLWQALSFEYKKIKDLEASCGKTRNSVMILLRHWNEAGLIEPTIQKGATYWRKKVTSDAGLLSETRG